MTAQSDHIAGADDVGHVAVFGNPWPQRAGELDAVS